MTLLEQISSDLACDETRALKGLGPLFMLLKLSVPRDVYTQIESAVPDATRWAHASADGGAGRTGELIALITPDNIRTRIRGAGFSDEEVDRLGQSVAQYLRESVGDEVADKTALIVPLVSEALAK